MTDHDMKFSDEEVVVALDTSLHSLGPIQRNLLEFCYRTDERDYCGELDAYPTPAMFLSAHLGISHWAACRYVKAGAALRTLPEIELGLCAGALSLDKVLELARFATAQLDAELAAWAATVSFAEVKRRADEATKRDLAQERTAEETRYLSWWWLDEGRQIAFAAQMPAAQGEVIVKAVERVVDDVPVQEHDLLSVFNDDDAAYPQRCADALAWICSQAVAGDGDADRATVMVHVEAGSEVAASLESGGFIHPEIARRLSCDCRREIAAYDHDAALIGIGRATRNVPRWLYRALKKRHDGCCSFPGCYRRGYLQAHHIRHWEHGGPTDLGNLVLVCHFHHKLVHEYRWRVVLRGRDVTWYRPSGEIFVFGPEPPPEHHIEVDTSKPIPELLPAIF